MGYSYTGFVSELTNRGTENRLKGQTLAIIVALLMFSSISNIPISAQSSRKMITFTFSETVRPSQGDQRNLAVAFHSFNFLNASGLSVGSIVFGTAAANQLQIDGCFGNENWPGVGTFQWAGGQEKKASMWLPVPEDATDLILNITGIKNGLNVNVTIDGLLVTKLRVDAYWHSAYVPLTEPVAEQVPVTEPSWSPGRYFPVFPAPAHVVAIRVSTVFDFNYPFGWSGQFRVNDSFPTMLALSLVSMQGIINRYTSSVYLVYDNQSKFWVSRIDSQVPVVYLDLDGLSAINYLYLRYHDFFNGVVVYDPAVADTINLATTIAGLENRVMVAPEELIVLDANLLSNVYDLRPLVSQFGWDNSHQGRVSQYTWLYNNLWPLLNHRIVGVVSPGPPTSGALVPPQNNPYGQVYLPLSIAPRDYIIALRLAALWLSPGQTDEGALFSQYLQDAPSPIPVFGFYGNEEYGTTALASAHGDFVPSISNPLSPLDGGDLSALSGIRPPIQRYEPGVDLDQLFATLGTAPVATVYSTDGDNIGSFVLTRGFPPEGVQWEGFLNRSIGFTISPLTVDLAPLVWDYYMGTRTSDISMVSGVSGAGYMYPALMNSTQLRAYLDHAATYLRETGLTSLNVDDPLTDEQIQEYYNMLNDLGISGIFLGYGGSPFGDVTSQFPYGLGFRYTTSPLPVVWNSYSVNSTNAQWIVNNLHNRKALEDTYILSDLPWKKGVTVPDPSARTGRAVAFQANNLGDYLTFGPYIYLPSGNYTVTYALKVGENWQNAPIATIDVAAGFPEGQGRVITERTISAAEFSQGGRWQNFTLSFSLAQPTRDVEFRVFFHAGVTALSADYIFMQRQGRWQMPVYAAVNIVAAPPTYQRMVDTPQIVNYLESDNVTVVSPDTFFLSLNPELLRQVASQLLGENNTGVIAAQQEIDQGDYMSALLSLRQQLNDLPSQTFFYNATIENQRLRIAISANAILTDAQLNASSNSFAFETHGPPNASMRMEIALPRALFDTVASLTLDQETIPFQVSENSTYWLLSATIPSGPHVVKVQGVLPQVTTTTASVTSTITSTTAATPTRTTTTAMTETSTAGTAQTTSTYSQPQSSVPWGLVGLGFAASASMVAIAYLFARRKHWTTNWGRAVSDPWPENGPGMNVIPLHAHVVKYRGPAGLVSLHQRRMGIPSGRATNAKSTKFL